MAAKAKSVIILLAVYVLIFWVGFRAGEIYNRVEKGFRLERIAVPVQNVDAYYIVEERGSAVEFTKCAVSDTNNAIMDIYNNEKLRPLLKLKKIQIYDSKGDRIY